VRCKERDEGALIDNDDEADTAAPRQTKLERARMLRRRSQRSTVCD